MKIKIIAFFIFLVLIFSSLGLGANLKSIKIKNKEEIESGEILYVGGSGPGNYTKIKDAIENASDGYTIYVYSNSSPYFENPVINISIDLIGEDKESTIIDGRGLGNVVFITRLSLCMGHSIRDTQF